MFAPACKKPQCAALLALGLACLAIVVVAENAPSTDVKEIDQGTEYLNKGAVHGQHSIPPPKGTPSPELFEQQNSLYEGLLEKKKGAVHGQHSIPPPKGTPSFELLEIGKKTRRNKSWLPDTDIFGHLIDHQDDEQVKTMAAEIDKDTAVLSKRAEKKMNKMVIKDAKEVDTAMAKEIKEEKEQKEKDDKNQAAAESAIKEIWNNAYHQMMVKKRRAAKLKLINERKQKKLAGMAKKRRTEVQFKHDCKVLAGIWIKAKPKQKKLYKKTAENCRSHGVELE